MLQKMKHILFCSHISLNTLQYSCVHSNLQNVKKFSNEIFKRNISGKPDAEEAPHIEGFVKPNIR